MCICNSTPLGIPEVLDVFGYKAPEQQDSLWCTFTYIGIFSSLERNMTCWEAVGQGLRRLFEKAFTTGALDMHWQVSISCSV